MSRSIVIICHASYEDKQKGNKRFAVKQRVGCCGKSAWFLWQRLRGACVGAISLPSGAIEIDETYMGNMEKRD